MIYKHYPDAMLMHEEKESLLTAYNINIYENKCKFNPASALLRIRHTYPNLNSLEDAVVYIAMDSNKDDGAKKNLSLMQLLNIQILMHAVLAYNIAHSKHFTNDVIIGISMKEDMMDERYKVFITALAQYKDLYTYDYYINNVKLITK